MNIRAKLMSHFCVAKTLLHSRLTRRFLMACAHRAAHGTVDLLSFLWVCFPIKIYLCAHRKALRGCAWGDFSIHHQSMGLLIKFKGILAFIIFKFFFIKKNTL